jgi:hypothetical protein
MQYHQRPQVPSYSDVHLCNDPLNSSFGSEEATEFEHFYPSDIHARRTLKILQHEVLPHESAHDCLGTWLMCENKSGTVQVAPQKPGAALNDER